jgi:hypothetical protein
MATINYNGNTYEIPDNILSQYKKPTWDRMTVLRGEWKPRLGEVYHYIPSDMSEISDKCTNNARCPDWAEGFIFTPTRELAEEYLLIAKGEWIPVQDSDTWCACSRGTLSHSWHEGIALNRKTDIALMGDFFHYFPSVKQLEEYISKQKPKAPTATIKMPDGTTYTGTLVIQ